MPRLRLSLTIPGELSLGAYEGGALAALIVLAKELGEDVLVIDSIAAGSPGSITGLLAARSLLEGVDPLRLLASAWVEDASLRAMEADVADPPLLSDALTAVAATLFGPGNTAGAPSSARQEEPVRLSMALGSLGGPTWDPLAQSSTPPDWYIVTLTNTAMPYEYLAYADAAIAAGSNAIRPPARAREPLDPAQRREEPGLLSLPGDGLFWYTVGGAVDNEALDRTIELAEEIESDDDRLYLVIDPDPAFPSRAPSGACGRDAPFPLSVGTGTYAFGSGHSPWIYKGLERLEGADVQVEWIGTKVVAADAVGDQPQADSQDSDGRFRRSLSGAIGGAHELVGRREAEIASVADRIMAERDADYSADYASLLGSLVDAGSEQAGRRHVPVEVISPAVDPSVAVPAWQQLVGAYCGFFDFTFRHSDFCLGYRNMSYWLEHRLNSYLPIDLSAALDKVERGYEDIRGNDGHSAQGSVRPCSDGDDPLTTAFHAGRMPEQDLISWGR